MLSMLKNPLINPTLNNIDGDQAIDIAAQNGFLDIVKLLLLDKRIHQEAKEEALRWAIRMNQMEVGEIIYDNLELNYLGS